MRRYVVASGSTSSGVCIQIRICLAPIQPITVRMMPLKTLKSIAVCTVSMTFAQEAKKKKDSVTFFIEAMDCDHCIKKIEKNIAFEKGVTDLKCDLSTRTAIVTYKTDKTSKTRLAAAFKKIGMEAVPVDNGAGCPVPPAKKSEHTHAH